MDSTVISVILILKQYEVIVNSKEKGNVRYGLRILCGLEDCDD